MTHVIFRVFMDIVCLVLISLYLTALYEALGEHKNDK
jgi:hypothetical protein